MRKLGLGVLGVGEMGKRHAENIRRLVPEARLIAVADASAERARAVPAARAARGGGVAAPIGCVRNRFVVFA